MKITERPRTYISEAEAWGSLPYDLRAVAYYYTDRFAEALDAVWQALRMEPDNERLKNNERLIAKALLRQQPQKTQENPEKD